MAVQNNFIQNKLILLFVFDKMEVPLSENTVRDMCCYTNNWLAYIDYKQLMLDLIDSGYIYKIPSQNPDALYTITPEGRSCLSCFYTKINASLREEITLFVKKNRAKYRKKQEYFSDYFKNADGTYTVSLKIIEPTKSLMDLKLIVESRESAKSIYKQWGEKAPQIYSLIYENLLEQ